jgi:hypothetical protein
MIMIVILEFAHVRLFSPFLFLMQDGIHIAYRRVLPKNYKSLILIEKVSLNFSSVLWLVLLIL